MTERKTPTTERVRDFYRGATGWRWEDGDGHTDLSGLRASLADEFDRWLAEHDAKVRAEGFSEGVNFIDNDPSPEWGGSVVAGRNEAARRREAAGLK